MRLAVGNDAQEIDFTLDRNRSRKHNPGIITHLDCADGIAIVTEKTKQTQDLLNRVQHNEEIDLYLNTEKNRIHEFYSGTKDIFKINQQ